jgi:hypothetical protein
MLARASAIDPKRTQRRRPIQGLNGSIQPGRSPASYSLRTKASDSSHPISASIAPTQPQQSPPQLPEIGSSGLSSKRPQIRQYFCFLLFIIITIAQHPVSADRGPIALILRPMHKNSSCIMAAVSRSGIANRFQYLGGMRLQSLFDTCLEDSILSSCGLH